MNNDSYFISHKNRGMLLEKLINTTINYYNKNKIAFLSKNNLEIKFSKITRNADNNSLKLNNSFIKHKSTVDYYGIYNGKYISFEAKSTEEKYLPFSNIKEHQHKHLQLIKELGGIAFYIIYFKKYLKIFLIDIEQIDFQNKKSISLEEIKKNGKELQIEFPGIIDFLSYI